MKIIIITGSSHTGKSTTVSKNFRDWLISQGAKEIEKTQQTPREYEGVFQYKGKTIALHSPGDAYFLIVFAIVKYTHLDVLVLTGKISVKAIAKLVEVIKANKNHCVIEKKEATDKDNSRVCDKIIAEL
jgi:tRNA uridine 5-carbamoylmethylation protein Kti12